MQIKEAIKRLVNISLRIYADDSTGEDGVLDMKAINTILRYVKDSVHKVHIEQELKQLDYSTSNRLELFYKKEALQKLLSINNKI